MAEVSDDSDYYYFDDEDYDLTQAELVEFTQNCPQLDDLDDKADFDETLSQHIQSTQVQLEEETGRGTQEENSCIQEETQPENTSRKRPRTENCAYLSQEFTRSCLGQRHSMTIDTSRLESLTSRLESRPFTYPTTIPKRKGGSTALLDLKKRHTTRTAKRTTLKFEM